MLIGNPRKTTVYISANCLSAANWSQKTTMFISLYIPLRENYTHIFFMHYYMKWKLMKYFPKDTFCHIINMTFTFELFLLTTTKLYFPRWWWFESNMAEYNTINEASLPWQVKCRSTHKDVWVLQWYIFRLYYFLPIWDDKPCLYIRALQPDHRKIVTCLREKF